MKGSTRLGRVLAAATIAGAALASLAPAAGAGPEPPPSVPNDIAVEAGNKPYLVAHAVGVQIYRCNVVGGSFTWQFVAPRADLYDDRGKLIITHFGGPTWEARDGSRVVGRREAGVNMDTSAIDWLRLAAASTSVGADGDRLASTTFIQRIETTGGVMPPASECNATTSGTVDEVPYTADYVFWKRTGA